MIRELPAPESSAAVLSPAIPAHSESIRGVAAAGCDRVFAADGPLSGAALRLRAESGAKGHGRRGRAGRVGSGRPHLRGRNGDRQDPGVSRPHGRGGRPGGGLDRNPPPSRTGSFNATCRWSAAPSGAGRGSRLLKGRSNYLCRWRYELALTSGRAVPPDVAARVADLSGVGGPDHERRPRRGGRSGRGRSGLAQHHLDRRQLPRGEVPEDRRLPCRRSAPPRGGGGRGGGQPPPPVRGHGAQGARVRGAAPARRHVDHRRGAPGSRRRDPVLRRGGHERAALRSGARYRRGGAVGRAGYARRPRPGRRAGGCGPRGGGHVPRGRAASRMERDAARRAGGDRDAGDPARCAGRGAGYGVGARAVGGGGGAACARDGPTAATDRPRAARIRLRALGGDPRPRVRGAPRPARHRADPRRARRRGGPGLDPDLRDPLRRGQPCALRGPGGHGRCLAAHLRRIVSTTGRRPRCYLPPGMPEPSRPDYDEAVANVAVSVLAASRGRAFLLFTSHRALHAVRRALDGRVPWPLLTQGERPRGELLRRFVETPGSVLLGTQSFWEGVDIRGDALSLVLIDRLPFAPPGRSPARGPRGGGPARGRGPVREHPAPRRGDRLEAGGGTAHPGTRATAVSWWSAIHACRAGDTAACSARACRRCRPPPTSAT